MAGQVKKAAICAGLKPTLTAAIGVMLISNL